MFKEEKDPAFLFYCTSFYEGTRTMLPEERACYVDLLIYQHQNGPIPLDTSRMHLYCVGVSVEMVNHVLNQKFDKTEQGWINKKMVKVVEERNGGQYKKIAASTLAGLISSNKNIKKEHVDIIKNSFKISFYENLEKEEIKEKVKYWFYKMVNHLVNNNIKDKDINKDKIKNIDKTEDINNNTQTQKSNTLDFDEILKIFNSLDHQFPKINKITSDRKTAIRARVKEHSLETVGQVFQIAARSDFLNGKSETGWKANFDWILKPSNFNKILEGNYENKTKNGTTNSQQDDPYADYKKDLARRAVQVSSG